MIAPFKRQQFLMVALFYNRSFVDDVNYVGVLDRTQSVSDRYCRSVLGGRIQGGLDCFFRVSVQCAV